MKSVYIKTEQKTSCRPDDFSFHWAEQEVFFHWAEQEVFFIGLNKKNLKLAIDCTVTVRFMIIKNKKGVQI